MKATVGLSLFLIVFSLNGWAQQIDYDKRNKHIFCSSHLAIVSEMIGKKADEFQALVYLSGMHRDEAKMLGATKKHFEDVTAYLRDLQANEKPKWERLSAQSKRVCLPNS